MCLQFRIYSLYNFTHLMTEKSTNSQHNIGTWELVIADLKSMF